jgi:hypothetical protein
MSAHDMDNAINHPHPDVHFSTIGDETITALTTLAAICKNKFKKPIAPVIIDSQLRPQKKTPSGTNPTNHHIPNQAQLSKISQTELNQAPPHVI